LQRDVPMADTTLLSWISTEVDQALNLVRERIAKFAAAPEDESVLKPCPEHLHQVSGALRMVGLTGATRFCESLESSFSHVTRATTAPVDKAVVALKQFVDGLIHGEANIPLRLFPAYRELASLQGRADASEKDLFFPETGIATPPHPEAKQVPPGELATFLQAQRLRFQRGMLGWLRNQPGGLDEMRGAVDALYQIAGQLPEPRGVWWAGSALLEGVQAKSAAEPAFAAAAKALGSKVDAYMRDLAAGQHKGNEALLREVLYTIATARIDTPRAQEVRKAYKLDSLFPPAEGAGAGIDLAQLQPALSDARSRLEALKGVWLQYISGEPKSAARFRELLGALRAKAGELGNPHLVKLLDALALVCAKLPDTHPQQNQFMVIEMASGFLLLDSIVETFASPPADLEEQIAILGGWLLDSSKGKSTGQPPAGLRADLSQEIGAMQLRAQVAKEILANLQHVEQVLDAFARDPGKRETLDGLQPHLRQIHGALVVLGLERAAEVLAICETMIAVLAAADHPQAAQDLDWIAEGLSSLGFYLDPCLRGVEPADQALRLFFRRYEQRGAAAAAPGSAPAARSQINLDDLVPDLDLSLEPAPVPDTEKTVVLPRPVALEAPAPAPHVDPEPSRPAVNQELLEIYLDEAGEVLATINGALPDCRTQPQNRDALTTIRRGFHTLKGSGRMVGLMDLGEVAWEIEQVMNRWLEQQRAATPTLLRLISEATASFAIWVDELRAGSLKAEIDAAAIVELARKLKTGEITEPPLTAPVEPGAESVAVGEVQLSRQMFDIFVQEAAGHAEALEQESARWQANRGAETPHEFLRAAHTLASSSRTAGFDEIANLAGAIEQWVPFARLATDPDDARPVQAAVEALKQMVDAVAAQQAPQRGADVTQALQGLTERLQAVKPADTKPEQSMALDLSAIDLDLSMPGVPKEERQPARIEPPVPAAPPAAAPTGRELRKMHDDIDEQLLPIFIEEAQTLLPQVGSDIRDWKANPSDQNVVQSLQRGLHTLKGSARMAGAIRLGELTHIMESLVEAALEKNQLDEDLFAELEEKMDRLSLDLERMQGKPEAVVAPTAVHEKELPKEEQKAQPRPAAPRAEPPLPSPAATLRVNADTLDHLINEAGEVSIARSRIEAELRAQKQSLTDLSESISRLRAQLREVEVQADSQMQSRKSELEERKTEFDPLEFDRYTRLQELTRLMTESLHDITSIQQGLVKNMGESEAAVLAQARTSRDVQQELMRMRAVPFSNLNERLYRIVRQTARDLEKKAELDIEGSQVELDRGVLEKIGAPLEHMLRNSLAHGLELPAARAEAGKPEIGRITVSLRQESNEIALILSDDGAGIDTEKLYRKALERGVVAADQKLSDIEKLHLIFASGLSTADKVTELAGRGVGMDVVRNDITSIGGRIDIASTRGKGTIFTIYLPLTLAVTQAVMVRAGQATLAISAAMVENVLRLKSDAMAGLYDRRMVEIGERSYPLHYLQQLLGTTGATDIQPYNSVLLLRSGIQRVALHVDELIGNQEIVVKSIGPQLARVPGVAGATVQPDGSIVLIMNPVQLAQHARLQVAKPSADAAAPAPEAEIRASGNPMVMVVDDSLTVRKITSRLLEREGYQVLTAKDGVDALQQLKDNLPAVMLVDIEMPRMDGFDLTKNVRADPRLAKIPIVIISSRTADKHRNQAAQLGVNAFLGKPYQETELLQHIATFVGASNPDIRLH
jgi:chemosensory pili system protein ChpA (sensor histidine kinase/response regulator)